MEADPAGVRGGIEPGISVSANVAPAQEVMGVDLRGGLRIETVFAGTPAALGGMQVGDILIGFHIWEITKPEDLNYALHQEMSGEVAFYVIRDGNVRKGYVLLDGSKRPESDAGKTPDQLTTIPVEFDRGHTVPNADSPSEGVLASLQGTWELELPPEDAAGSGGEPELKGVRAEVTIEGNLLKLWEIVPPQPGHTTETVRTEAGAMLLTPGSEGPPQQIDLVIGPNDGDKRRETQGIIEITGDTVRLCYDPQYTQGEVLRPTAFAKGKNAELLVLKRRPAVAEITELEGDWHVVQVHMDGKNATSFRPINRTFQRDRLRIAWPGGGYECRIKVNPKEKTIRNYSMGEDRLFTKDHYELNGNQLIFRNAPEDKDFQVYERGHVRFPLPVDLPSVSQAQKWRSGVVELFAEWNDEKTGTQQQLAGYGTVVTEKNWIVGQVRQLGPDSRKFYARCDDGSLIPLEQTEESSNGWAVFQPRQPTQFNFSYTIASTDPEVGDAVRTYATTGMTLTTATLTAKDRQFVALGMPEWQLERTSERESSLAGNAISIRSLPILNGEGELLGLSISETGNLSLVLPTSSFPQLLPKTFGPSATSSDQSPPPPAEPPSP